eukprot:6492669-Amphidinium_carterae.1
MKGPCVYITQWVDQPLFIILHPCRRCESGEGRYSDVCRERKEQWKEWKNQVIRSDSRREDEPESKRLRTIACLAVCMTEDTYTSSLEDVKHITRQELPLYDLKTVTGVQTRTSDEWVTTNSRGCSEDLVTGDGSVWSQNRGSS